MSHTLPKRAVQLEESSGMGRTGSEMYIPPDRTVVFLGFIVILGIRQKEPVYW